MAPQTPEHETLDSRQDELADSLARERASDPRRCVLLQAPAGSGKTTVLTERLLRLLAEVDEPEEILAITFTRKAAAEMRDRVLQALRRDVGPSDAMGARLRRFAEAALARDEQRGWNLAHDPGRLRIQTIDSFNFRLASQLTVAAKAGCALVIADRPRELYERAARRTLMEAQLDPDLAADVDLLFERLDNHWRNVSTLLADMLRQRGHWLRYVLAHDAGALCERISESLRRIVAEQLAAACRRIPATLLAEAAALPDVGELSSDPSALARWQRLAMRTLTQEGDWRKPGGINRRLGTEYESSVAQEALKALIERFAASAGVRQVLLDVAALPAPELAAADSEALRALSRVLRVAAAQLQTEFATAGRVDHTYVAGAARSALTDAGLPTDLALRMGLSLRHILVDEFQDTSLAQFDLLEMLTVGWEEGDGRTLFVVGDPMQSIYQFREAEVGLFLRARDHGIGSVRLEPLRLTRNFRSVPALIGWINDTFAELFPPDDDLRASAVTYTPSLAGRPASDAGPPAQPGLPRQLGLPLQPSLSLKPGPATVRLFIDGDRRSETAAITRRIGEIKATHPAATIAVLVASRSHAAPIMTDLETNSVPVIGVDLVPLREVSIVRDLVSLLRAMSHPGDRAAWLAVLRAPWCGVTLETLTHLSRRGDPLVLWEALQDADRLADCAPEERIRLERVRRVIAGALAARDHGPLADWLELTWLRLGSADCYPGEDLRHARAFFDVLSKRAAAGEWSGHDLDALLEDLFAQPQSQAANPVQIMTIHRAKGLEFDHVFLPSLDCRLNNGREPLLRWLDLPRAIDGSDLIMAPVPAIGDDSGGDVSAYIKRLTSLRAANEQVRLLYVAATRARKTLQISAAPEKKADGTVVPMAGTLLACMWPVAGRAQAEAEAGCPSPGKHSSPPSRLCRLATGWALPELQSSARLPHLPLGHRSLEPPEFSWVQETARHIGTVVHAALEKLAAGRALPAVEEIEGTRASYVQQLRRHGVPEKNLSRAGSLVVEALIRTVTNERGRWLFAPSHRDARSEWALTGIAGGRLARIVIDRSFIDADGTRWVVDFKTSRHEGGGLEAFLDQEMQRYRAQLQTYVELTRGMGSQPVRAGLYFPLLDAFRELV